MMPTSSVSGDRTYATPQEDSWVRRTVIGAAIGILVVLFLLPQSRPLFQRVIGTSFDAHIRLIQQQQAGQVLMNPLTPSGCAEWVQAACVRISHHEQLGIDEENSLAELIHFQATKEPDNAFWYQSLALIEFQQGREARAVNNWIRASYCPKWNTYETERLETLPLPSDPHGAAEYASLQTMRSEAFLIGIVEMNQAILTHSDWDSPQGLLLRAATVLNGQVIRKYARTISTVNAAVKLQDQAVIQPGQIKFGEHRQLLLARFELARRLRAVHENVLASGIIPEFNEADSELALLSRDKPNAFRKKIQTDAAIADVLPGALMEAISVSALLAFLALLLEYCQGFSIIVKSAGLAVVAVGGMFIAVRMMPIAAALTLVASLLTLGLCPKNVRASALSDLGPLHRFLSAFFGFGFVIAAALGFLMRSPTGSRLLAPQMPSGFDWAAADNGLMALFLASLLLMSPLYAFARRIPTLQALKLTCFRSALSTVWGLVLTLAIISPLCFVWDRTLVVPNQQVLGNEPVFHLSHD